jgi:hypothetical protein
MQVSTSAFYVGSNTPKDTDKIKQDEALKSKVQQIFDANKKTYGAVVGRMP